MSNTDADDIVVKIEDDGAVGNAAAAAKTAVTNDEDPITDLKGQFATMQQKLDLTSQQLTVAQSTAQQAIVRAANAEEELTTTRKEKAQSDLDTVDAGITAAEAEAATAQRDFEIAAESGDFKAQGIAQRKMAQAESRKTYLETNREHIEAAAKATAAPRPQAAQQQQSAADPVEAFIQTRTPMTQQWLRKHTDYITDPAKNNKLTAGHYDAMSRGHQPDTEAYFQHVEKFVGIDRNDQDPADNPKTREVPGRRPASGAASPASSGGGVSGGAQEVRLNKGEVERATDGTLVWNYDDPTGKGRFQKGDPIGVQEFARRKAQMKKDGLYDRNFTDN